MALMAAHGEITPMPDGAIFADTQAEPQSVYDWLEWLERQLPYPVHRVSAGDLATKAQEIKRSKRTGREYIRELVPLFLDMGGGAQSMLWRRCTTDFKLRPIVKKLRTLIDLPPAHKRDGVFVTQWIGISRDEALRMKSPLEPWIANRYPLVDMDIHRHHCIEWMKAKGYPSPPRSACVFCPYHNNAEWKRLKDEEPDSFRRAVEWERNIQELSKRDERWIGVPYLHRQMIPLDAVDFDRDDGQINMFGNDCEGMCGV